jgi:hypothetical protein
MEVKAALGASSLNNQTFEAGSPKPVGDGTCVLMVPVVWHWSGPFSIAVSVPANPTWAHRVISNALAHWNTEQVEFEGRYHLTGTRYVFQESQSNSEVQVSYGTTSNILLAYTTPVDYNGGQVDRVDVVFNQSLIQVPDNSSNEVRLFRVALHEFGHVLGLGEAYFNGDIMNGWGQLVLNLTRRYDVTTLDLYIVNVLSTVTGNIVLPWFVCKPSNIPYVFLPSS